MIDYFELIDYLTNPQISDKESYIPLAVDAISSIQAPIFTNLDKNLFPSAKRHVVYYIDEIIKEGEY